MAHDLGTTGDKAVLFDLERGMVGRAFSAYPTAYPQATWAEQDPNDWWRAFCEASREVISFCSISPEEIAVISFSGQMMGCLPLDREGVPLRRAIIWADQRATAEAMGLLERVPLEDGYRITGHRIGPAYSVAKIMWLAAYEPEVFEKTYKFLQAKDFIAHKLTGKWATDFSDACGTGLLHIHKRCWSEEIAKLAGIDLEKLPPVHPSTEVVGEVTREAASEAALSPGIPVVIGGGDGVCATAGAGVVDEGVGHIYLGSSAWVAGASRGPVLDPKMRTFTWPHLDPGLYSPNGTMHNAGSSLEWAKEALGALELRVSEWLGLNPYDLLEKEAERVPAGAEGLIFLPYLMGERSPNWNPDARGVFLGITRKHTKAHLLRAVYEGVAFNLRTIFQALGELGVELQELRVIGGGAKSRLWTQILADVLGRPLTVTAAPQEATALGAAMAGAVGAGLLRNFREAADRFVELSETVEPRSVADVYEELHSVFLKAYEALVPVFALLVGKGGANEQA